jgi:tetraacyldisaccharide 4'-kinase
MRGAIERAWKRQGIDGRGIRLALLPASALFSTAVRLRMLSYRWHLRRRRALPAAVVSVGNLSVGGTGKTPTALWLAESLQQRGYSVAILSRGYGGKARGPTLVGTAPRAGIPASTDVTRVGDENVLLARRFSGSVVVARRRAEAGALACRELGANVLVLDDGFQHLALQRDFDLVCVRTVDGDDRVLPAGRLREPPAALGRADAVLVSDGKGEDGACPALAARLASVPSYRGQLRAVTLVTPVSGEWRELPMGLLAARKVLGVTGLADPQPFYRTLRDWEARIQDYLEFADHHVYTLGDWKTIVHRSRDLDLVVTTEKDLVKLEQFPFAKEKLVAVRVSMHVENGSQLLDSIVAAIERRRAELADGLETRLP